MSRVLLFSCCVFLGVLAGCEEPVDSCAVASDYTPSLALGVGMDSFRALEHGDRVELEYGMQGGQHIWVGVQTTGIAPGEQHRNDVAAPEIRYQLLADGVQVGAGSNEVPLSGDVSFAQRTGDTLVLDWFDASEFESLVVRVTVADACGTALVQEREITLPTYD